MDNLSTIIELVPTIVALIAAVFAWVTFRFSRYDKLKAENDSTQKALNALKGDLNVISGWAHPYDDRPLDDYRVLKDGSYYKDWRRPHRVVFRFNYDAVRGIRQNPPTPTFDNQLLHELALLDHAITNFFSLLDRYERMVQGEAELGRKVYRKTEEEKSGISVEYTKEEKELQEVAFRLNYQIHVGAIGAQTEKDKKSPGLHWAYEQVQQSVERVEKTLKKPGAFSYEHKFYIGGDLVALGFLGVVLFFLYRLFTA